MSYRQSLKKVASIILTLSLSSFAWAANYPKPIGPVNDFANVIDQQNKTKLTTLLTALQNQTGIAMVIVTIPSLEGSDIESYAVDLYKKWGVGQKGSDKGILILAAIKDRNARIEVGYGLESVVPDAFAGRILREVLFPYFKKGLYGEGLLETSLVLVEVLQNKLEFQLETEITATPQTSIPRPFAILFFLILLYLFIRHPILFLMFFSGGGGGYGGGFRGGGGGGGFGGFGGGLSGGGGASGRW